MRENRASRLPPVPETDTMLPTPSPVPSASLFEQVARGMGFLYDHVSVALIIDGVTARMSPRCGCHERECLTCNTWSARKAQVTDVVVLLRMLAAALLVLLVGVLRNLSVIALAGLLIYDTTVAHFVHLVDPDVGSAGPGMRLSTRRSLLIAMLNIFSLTLAFGSFFRYFEKTGFLEAMELSWSSMSTLGLSSPGTDAGTLLALIEVAIGLFMFGVIISTILAGFEERAERRRGP